MCFAVSVFQVGSSGHHPWRLHFKMMTLRFLFLKDLLLPAAPAALWLTYHLSILMNDRKETILKHLQNLGRGSLFKGHEYCFVWHRGSGVWEWLTPGRDISKVPSCMSQQNHPTLVSQSTIQHKGWQHWVWSPLDPSGQGWTSPGCGFHWVTPRELLGLCSHMRQE